MASYTVTLPDGRSYTIEAPDGTTDIQAYQYLQQSLRAEGNQGAGRTDPIEYGTEESFESENAPWYRDVADVGVGFLSGVSNAAGAIVGLGSYVPGVNKLADPLAAKLQDFGDYIGTTLYSDRQKEINAELGIRLQAAAEELGPDASIGDMVDNMVAQGGEAAEFIKDHPTQVVNLAVQSLPYIFGGGVITKGAKAGAKATGLKKVSDKLDNPITGAAVGEGLIVGGQAVTDAIAETDSVGDYSVDRLKAAAAIPTTGLTSMVGGRVANRIGIDDIDTLIGSGGGAKDLLKSTSGSMAYKTIGGGLIEGSEEFVQGATEQVAVNWAADKNLLEDVGGEAVIGAATGMGQGAVVNLTTSLVGDPREKARERKAVIEAEEENRLVREEEAYMEAAYAVETPEDLAAFAESQGVTVEQIQQDDRFTRAQQLKQQDIELNAQKELRIKYAATMPDESEWYKEEKAKRIEQQRIEASDETTELGAQFKQWRKDNDVYDTNPKVIESWVEDNAGSQEFEATKDDFLAALDEHIALQQGKENRTPEEQAAIDANIEELLVQRNEAIASNDMTQLGVVEKTAAQALVPAEWAEAKRAKPAKTKKGAKPKAETTETKEAAPVEETPAPVEETTDTVEETPTPVEETTPEEPAPESPGEQAEEEITVTQVNPFREFNDKEGKRPNKKHIRYRAVAEEIGYGFEDNDTSDVYQAVFKAINNSASDKRINKLMREVQDLKAADAIADPRMRVTQPRRLGKWQQAVIPFLMDAARRGTLDDYRSFSTDKGWQWFNNTIAEAIEEKAGVKLTEEEIRNAGKRVNDAINAYKNKQIELGRLSKTRETAEEFNERLDNKWLRKILSQGAARDTTTVSDSSEIAAALDKDINDPDTFDITQETGRFGGTGGQDTRTEAQQLQDAADNLSRRSSAGSGEISGVKTDKDIKDYVDQFANKADPKQVARVQESQMEALKAVDTAHQNTNFKNRLSSLWKQNNLERGAVVNGEGNNLTELGYMSQPPEVQAGWIVGVQLAIDNRRLDTLPEYFESLVYAHSDRIEANNKRLEGTTEMKARSRLRKRSKKVRELGTTSQEKVAEIQTEGAAVRKLTNQKKKLIEAQEAKKAKEKRDAKIAKQKAKAMKAQIAKNKAERKAKEAKENEKTDSSRKSEGQTVPKKSSASSTRKKSSRTSADQDGRRSTKKIRKIQKSSFDRIDPETTSRELIDNLFKTLLGKSYKKVKKRIVYYETVGAAYADGWGTREDLDGTSAFVSKARGEKGERVAGEPDVMVFILENIPKGQEASIFMHEVGGHIGLDNILTLKEQKALEKKIDTWYEQDVAKNGDSATYLTETNYNRSGAETKEHFVARHAVKRALAKPYQNTEGRVSPEIARAEKIAFFLQVATELGFRPSETTETGKVLNKFKQAFIKFLRNMQLLDENTTAELNAQDIVDMAYGAAKIELERGFRLIGKLPSQQTISDIETTITRSAEEEINRVARLRFPKNDKNKYVAPGFLPKDEWRQFQISQGRAEKQFREAAKAKIEQTRREAAENEARMSDPDGKQYSKSFSKQEKQESVQEAKEFRDTVKKIPGAGSAMAEQLDNFTDIIKKGAQSIEFLHTFINKVKSRMPSAEKWHKAYLMMEKTRFAIKQDVDSIAIRARQMNPAELKQTNEFIAFSTLEQKWGYDPEIEGKTVKIDARAKIRFNKLNKNQQEMVKEVFAHGEKMLKRKQAIAKAAGVSSKFFSASGLDGPYAPLKRFGNHVTELKSQELLDAEKALSEKDSNANKAKVEELKRSADHYVISFFDTKGRAKAFRDEQDKNYASAKSFPRQRSREEGRTADYAVLQKVLGNIGAVNLDPKAKASVEKMITDMYLQSLDDTNARQSQAKRKGTAGYEQNMIRSFLSHAGAEANLIATMEHGATINSALSDMVKEKKQDEENLGPIYNMIIAHYNASMENKQTPIQDRIAAINTVYMLTSSVGYHLTNATQPQMVTIPKLAGDFGKYGRAQFLLGRGYKIAASGAVKVNLLKKGSGTEIDLTKVPERYKELLEELQLRQLLDVGMEQDLSEFTRFNTGVKLIDGGSEKAANMSHKLYQVARLVEAYNRISAAVAAYDLATENPTRLNKMGMSPAEYAIGVVEDTQGNFSTFDAPLAIKKLPKIITQYRKYQIMMGWVYAKAARAAFGKGSTLEERWVGGRTLAYLIGQAAVFSGVRGLPGMALIAPVYFAMFGEGEDDEPQDVERSIRDHIQDEKLATLISRGLPSMLGVDMTTKIGQENIFSLFPYVDFGLTQEAIKDAVFGMALGPTGSTLSNFVRSVEYANEGNAWRSVEYAIPKGFRHMMEAYRLGTEGYSLRNGDIVGRPEDFSELGLVLTSLGIPATEVQSLKWTRGQQFEISQYFSDAQAKIRKKYIKAHKEKDTKLKNKLKEEWMTLQRSKKRLRPFFNDNYKSLRFTPVSSLILSPMQQRRRERNYMRELGTN